MSYAERPVETLVKFAQTPGWTVAPVEELTADFLSIHHETNLLPDYGWYEIENNDLIDSLTKKSIEATANSGTSLDQPESEVNKQLKEWAIKNESGIAVWISPKKEGFYPGEKLSIYRIAYKFTGEKVILRSHILFNANLKNSEDLRRFIFTEEDKEESIFGILNWIEKVSEKSVNTNYKNQEIRRQQAEFYAQQYRSGISIEQIVYNMAQTGFLGENPISCGGGGNTSVAGGFGFKETQTLSFGFEDQYGSLNFSCPKCGATNTRPVGQLISNCQHCGGDVRC